MKRLLLFILTCSCWLSGRAQHHPDYYRGLAYNNMRSLDLYGYLQYRVKSTDSTFVLIDLHGRPEIKVRWEHVAGLMYRLNNWNVDDLISAFEHRKLTAGLATEKILEPKAPTLKGLVLALDPGHMASNRSEAVWEDKYVKVHTAGDGELFFNEARLTDLTAAIVEMELEKRGAVVVLSRSFGNTAFGKTFKQWLRDDFKAALERDKASGELSDLEFSSFGSMHSSYDSMYVFHHYFKNLEFRQRQKNLDDANPDLAINIHYNAHEKDIRDEKGFNNPVTVDYSMAFAPGGFMPSELESTREKLDFMRLLFSKSIEHSIKLSDLILQNEIQTAGIQPVSFKTFDVETLHSKATNKPGVMLRNLAMNRILRCPVSYLEALLQDNVDEIPKLVENDYEFSHPDLGQMHAPMRCKQVADAIVKAVEDYCKTTPSSAVTSSLKTPKN